MEQDPDLEELSGLVPRAIRMLKESDNNGTTDNFKEHVMSSNDARSSSAENLAILNEKELQLAAELRDHDMDLEKDSNIMKELGMVYSQRAITTQNSDDFVKASALYNAALLRTSMEVKQDTIKTCLAQNEKQLLIKVANGQQMLKLPSDFTEYFKADLHGLRTEISTKIQTIWQHIAEEYNIGCTDDLRTIQEEKLTSTVKDICSQTSEKMKHFIRSILRECYQMLEPIPQRYAMVGLGSLAREEMTTYSDLEFVILIEEETKDKHYFRNLTTLFHIFVLNLGETLLPAVGIKSLNDFDKQNGDWFYDKVTTNGFCFDGSMPWASKTPRGRPDRTSKKGIELIQTPEKMASFTEFSFATKEGYHLGHMLKTSTLIDGSKDLFDKFTLLLSRNTEATDEASAESKLAIIELGEDLIKYMPKLNLHKSSDIHIQNVKKEIYRLPTIIINNLKPIFKLQSNTLWELLYEMTHRKLIQQAACHNLMVAMSISVLLRLLTYMKNEGQRESLSFLKQFSTDEKSSGTYFCENEQVILRYYITMIPFTESLLQSCLRVIRSVVFNNNEIIKFNILLDQSGNFYHASGFTIGRIYHTLLMYAQALASFQNVLDSKENITSKEHCLTLHCMASVYSDMNDYKKAVEMYLQSHKILKDIHGEGVNSNVASSLASIARIYSEMGDYQNAHTYQLQALHMRKEIYGDDAHPVLAIAFNDMAALYRYIGDYSNALEHNLRALEMNKQIHVDVVHDGTATSLNNTADLYLTMGNYKEALEHHLQALNMYKEIHGPSAHPDLARSFNNIAEVYRRTGNYNCALKYFLPALQMNLQIHDGGIHRDIARSLNNIGTLYMDTGDYSNSLKYYTKAFDMNKKIHGDVVHPDTAMSYSFIATLYNDTGNYNKALVYHLNALQMRREIHGDSIHPDLAECYNNTADTYRAMGNYDNARRLQTIALAMNKQIHGNQPHPNLASALSNMATLCRDLGDWNNSLKYHLEALLMEKQIHGESVHPDVAKSLNNVADSYVCIHDYQNGLKYHLESLNMSSQINKDGVHRLTAISLQNIAELYMEIRDYENAFKYQEQSLQMMKKVHGDDVDHPDIFATLCNIATLYDEVGNNEIALIYEIRAFQMIKKIPGYSNHPNATASLEHAITLFSRLMLERIQSAK